MKKNILLLTLAILITESAFCILDTIQAKSKITDVTVFFSGAQISRKADLKIAKGKFLVIVDHLPQEINPQSIQVAGIEHCKILSVKHQLNYSYTVKYPKGTNFSME